MGYLEEKVKLGHICLYCNGKGKTFHSYRALQQVCAHWLKSNMACLEAPVGLRSRLESFTCEAKMIGIGICCSVVVIPDAYLERCSFDDVGCKLGVGEPFPPSLVLVMA